MKIHRLLAHIHQPKQPIRRWEMSWVSKGSTRNPLINYKKNNSKGHLQLKGHPETGAAYYRDIFNMGSVLQGQRKHDEASKQLQKALDAFQETFGYDHDWTKDVARRIMMLKSHLTHWV